MFILPSFSEEGVIYIPIIEETYDRMGSRYNVVCNCPAYQKWEDCKHSIILREMLERKLITIDELNVDPEVQPEKWAQVVAKIFKFKDEWYDKEYRRR